MVVRHGPGPAILVRSASPRSFIASNMGVIAFLTQSREHFQPEAFTSLAPPGKTSANKNAVVALCRRPPCQRFGSSDSRH
jgi:hypothetical protein